MANGFRGFGFKGCDCCGGGTCSCAPCSFPQADLTMTIVADGNPAYVCNPSSQSVTMTFSGSCASGEWLGSIDYPSSPPFEPGTIYFKLFCAAGFIRLIWKNGDPSLSPPDCILNASDADFSHSCDPLNLSWVAPHVFADGTPSAFVCGCRLQSITITP